MANNATFCKYLFPSFIPTSLVKFYCQTVAFTFRSYQMYGDLYSLAYSDLCSISSRVTNSHVYWYIYVYEHKGTRICSENLKAFAKRRDEWQMRLINLKYIRTIQILLNSWKIYSHILLRQDGILISACSDLSADLNFAEMRSITYGLILEQEYEWMLRNVFNNYKCSNTRE